jgi:hypothetical protein
VASTHAPRFAVVWICTFLAFVAAGTVWNLTQPLLSTADEGQHFLDAQAVWSGQFVPRLVPGGSTDDGVIHVHNLVGAESRKHGFRCFNFLPDRSARCDTAPLVTTSHEVDVGSYVAREPPLPSLLNGLPAFVDPDRTGFVLSRLLDTIMSAAVLATALAMCVQRRRPLLAAGVVVAFTPCALAETGAIGTSPLEVAAAILTWTAVALLVDGEAMRARFATLLVVAATAFVLSRPLSVLWLAITALTIPLACTRARLREILASTSGRIATAVVAVASLAAAAWAEWIEAPATPHSHYVERERIPQGILARINLVLSSLHNTFPHMIGAVGGDYGGPWPTVLIWTALAGTLVLAGIAVAPARLARTIIVLVGAFFGVSFVVQVIGLPQFGYFWHGRYDLPTFAGVVILAAMPLDGAVTRLPRLARLATVVLVGAALGQILELAASIRRFAVGLKGTLDPFSWGHGWHPPVPSVVLLAVGIVVLAGTYACIGACLQAAPPVETPPLPARGMVTG